MAGEYAHASHPTCAAKLYSYTPPHTAAAAKLGHEAAPPRARAIPARPTLKEKTT